MKEKIAIISIVANVFLAGVKIWVGFFIHSSSVLAEGFHSLTDIFSSFIGYFGIKASQKPVDDKHPYGYYKFEVLSGVVITLILLATGLGIVYNSYLGFLNPDDLKISYLAIFVMFLSGVINYITSRLKIFYGKKENSLTLISDGVHDRADVLVSLAVFGGLILSPYWVYTDSLLAFLIGLYIIKESFSLGKEAVDSLLDVSAGEDVQEKINSISKKQGIEISDCKTQKKGATTTVNLEIKLPSNLKIEEAVKISEDLKGHLMSEIHNLSYVAIQIKSHDIETDFFKPFLGRGFGWQRVGKFQDGVKEASGKGPSGFCICPKCGYETLHRSGVPCSSVSCPNCSLKLERK